MGAFSVPGKRGGLVGKIFLPTTPRESLRAVCGVNVHFVFNPSVFAVGTNPDPDMINFIIKSGVRYIRERWRPGNKAQFAAWTQLADAGVRFYTFIGDTSSSLDEITSDTTALANSPIAKAVKGVCGPNECNSSQNDTWQDKTVKIQKTIFQTVDKYAPMFADDVEVVSACLKHNVPNLDGDYVKIAAAGIQPWCTQADFHYYPGNGGPISNANEASRARQAFGSLPLWHSETGWTGADTTPDNAGRFTIEAFLRNYLTGIVGTIIYELADEGQYVSGREGKFGMCEPAFPKLAHTWTSHLLTTPDGNEDFPGWLADFSEGVESDSQAVVVSDGAGYFTVHLLKIKQGYVNLTLPPGYASDVGALTVLSNGNSKYKITYSTTMMTAHIRPVPIQFFNER